MGFFSDGWLPETSPMKYVYGEGLWFRGGKAEGGSVRNMKWKK